MVEESLARLVPRADHFSVTRSLLNLDVSPDILRIKGDTLSYLPFFEQCRQQLYDAGIISRLTKETFSSEIKTEQIKDKLNKEKRGTYPLYLDLILVEDAPGRLQKELEETRKEHANPDFSFLLAQRMGANSGFIYLLAKSKGRISQTPASATTKKHVGFIRIELSDKPGTLKEMLKVLGNNDLNIDSCFAYATMDGKATALISLGDVADAEIKKATQALINEQFIVPTKKENEAWLNGPLAPLA